MRWSRKVEMEFEWVNCKICPKIYKRALKKKTGRNLPSGIKGINTITCSRRCSRDNAILVNKRNALRIAFLKRREKQLKT